MARDSIEKEAECEDFAIDIPAELPPAKSSEYCCIYRVHKRLRNVSKEAYTPKLVSIGPLHYRREELRDMDMHKLRYFNDFFQRPTVKKSQKDLASIIAANEETIRHCYSETSKLSRKEFVKMILLDSIFIIELFLKDCEEAEEEDFILSTVWLRDGILIDLILLENQLPFFVLEDLHASAFYDSSRNLSHQREDQNEEDTPFLELARCFFSYYDTDTQRKSNIPGEVKHFTDLVRYFLCSSTLEGSRVIGKKQKNLGSTEDVHHLRSSAAELDRAELKFKAVENRHLLDIKFPGNKWLKYCPCFNLSWLLACLPCLNKQKNLGSAEDVHHLRSSAVELDRAELKLKAVENRHLLDITFQGSKRLKYCPCFNLSWLLACLPCLKSAFPGLEHMQCILEVPKFLVEDRTECLLRNLMALEQHHYLNTAYICNYIWLLDDLIDTEKDVELLVNKEIISNMLGSNAAVATLFNKLCLEIVEIGSCYSNLAQEINEYCDNYWNRIMATMKSVYFRDFWRGTATVVALFILFCQFWAFLQSLLEKK